MTTATKTTHTPGPWTVHGDNKTLIGCDDRKMMLAEVLWEHVCTEWGRPIEEAQANARLIAAAPDLLAALIAVRDFSAASAIICAKRPDIAEMIGTAIAKAHPR